MPDTPVVDEPLLVTSALPYANGPLHLGHLAGVYLPADIYVRFQRLNRRDVLHVCGSDEHGVPIMLRARREGVDPQEIVDRYHEQIRTAFSDLGISFDHYGRTSDPIHRTTSQEFFASMAWSALESRRVINSSMRRPAFSWLIDCEAPVHIVGTRMPMAINAALRTNSTLRTEESAVAVTDSVPEERTTAHWYLLPVIPSLG